MGIDAFVDIAKWYEASALLKSASLLSRAAPGYSLADVANALPEKIRPVGGGHRPFQKQAATGDLVLPGATIRLLDGVHQKVSSSAIREAAAGGKALSKLVNPAVAEYIQKMSCMGSAEAVWSLSIRTIYRAAPNPKRSEESLEPGTIFLLTHDEEERSETTSL